LISVAIIQSTSLLMEINLVSSLINGAQFSDYVITANNSRQGSITLIYFLVIISEGILFLIWFYRAYLNLPSLRGSELSMSPRLAIIYFFIPILNLYKPYVAMKEIWHTGEPHTQLTNLTSRKLMKTPYLIKSWWAMSILFVIMNFVGRIIQSVNNNLIKAGLVDGGSELERLVNFDMWLIFINILIIISHILLLYLVNLIRLRQENKSKQLQ